MLSNREVEQYRELGYLVVPDVLDAPMLAEVRRMVDGIVADAGKVATHTEVYDLEDSHSSEQPRVRRIKTPHKHFPFFAELTRNPRITAILAQLLGPDQMKVLDRDRAGQLTFDMRKFTELGKMRGYRHQPQATR